MADSYPDILKNRSEKSNTIDWIIGFLSKHSGFVNVTEILKNKPEQGMLANDMTRGLLQTLTEKGFIESNNAKQFPSYRFSGKDAEAVKAQARKEIDSDEASTIPPATQLYYDNYAFERLVSDVSRWVNYSGVTEREYNIDRLWTGRYIDFLDKANEWVLWHKADQALAKKRLSDAQRQNKSNNP
jgi:hypothetical protein